jgi:hypothetical protein
MEKGDWTDLVQELYRPIEGEQALTIKAEPTLAVNRWGRQVLRIETDKGILMTGSFAVMRALKNAYLKYGTLVGAKLVFTVAGQGVNRRYTSIEVFPPSSKAKK